VLTQVNREPQQRIRKATNAVQEGESSSDEEGEEEEEEPASTRRSTRTRRPTKRYMERDSTEDDESFSET